MPSVTVIHNPPAITDEQLAELLTPLLAELNPNPGTYSLEFCDCGEPRDPCFPFCYYCMEVMRQIDEDRREYTELQLSAARAREMWNMRREEMPPCSNS